MLSRGSYVDLAVQQIRPDDLNFEGATYVNGQIAVRALVTFATLVYGSNHRHAGVLEQGYVHYGGAIRKLNEALSEPGCHMRDDVLLSVAVLALLETLMPTVPGWSVMHTAGLERLLELRGPASYNADQSVFQLYKGVRCLLVVNSLHSGNTPVFTQGDWKAAVAAGDLANEVKLQNLFDVLSECKRLATHGTELLLRHHEKSSTAHSAFAALVKKASALLVQLRVLRQGWESQPEEQHPVQPTRSSDTTLMHALVTYETSLSPSIDVEVGLLYGIALINVLRLLAACLQKVPEDTVPAMGDGHTAVKELRLNHQRAYASAEHQTALGIVDQLPRYLGRTASYGRSPLAHWAVLTA